MAYRFAAIALAIAPLWFQDPASLSPEEQARMDAQNAALREIVKQAPKLPLQSGALDVTGPCNAGWALGMVSWVAAGPDGLIYLLQRGENADPVIVVDRSGKIVRSWGKGMYTTPHAIRVDPQGNVWTTDAASSMVYKFSPQGKKLLADRSRRPAHTVQSLLQHDRRRLRAQWPRLHRRWLSQRAHSRVHAARQEGARMGRGRHRARAVPAAALDPGRRQRDRLRRRSRERAHSAIRSEGTLPRRVVAVRQDVRLEARRRRDLVVEHSARSQPRARAG